MKNVTEKSNSVSKTSMRGLPNAPLAMPAQSLERRRTRRTTSVLPFVARIAAK